MSQIKVRRALEAALKTWATANTITVNWQNTPSDNTLPKYVSPTIIPAEMIDPSIGANHKRYVGTLRVLVRTQSLTKGMLESETIAESLSNYFRRGSVFINAGLNVHIERSPSIRPSYIDGMYMIVPVDVQYRADLVTI